VTRLIRILLIMMLTLSCFVHGSQDKNLLLFMADKNMELGNFSAALNTYISLLANDPKNPILNNRVGYAYYKSGHYNKALSYLGKAHLLNPTNAAIHNNLGVCYYRMSDYTNAEQHYRKAVFLNKENPKYHFNLAATCFYQRKYATCLEHLLKSYKLDKDYVADRADRKKSLKAVKEMRQKYPDDKELAELEKRISKLNK